MSGSSGQSKPSVPDKRLRALYELLDTGKNLKVLSESEKLTKKYGACTTVKLVKSLALIRVNNSEDARQILNGLDLTKNPPVDDNSINTLSIIYQELDDAVSWCAILEAASKKKGTEEILTQCFMAHVRISDFHKQYLTALTMYKTFNNPSYFGWAISSLLLKYQSSLTGTASTPGSDPGLPLQLAERMCEKFFSATRQFVGGKEQIFYLYLEVLKKLDNWDGILKLLKDGYYFPITEFTHGIYCEMMLKNDKIDELFIYLKTRYWESPDDYEKLKEIITLLGSRKKEEVLVFLNNLRETKPNRVVGLCDLLFCHEHLKGDVKEEDFNRRVQEDFEMIAKFGASKLSFYSEMVDNYKLLPNQDSVKKMLQLLNPIRSEEENGREGHGGNPGNAADIVKEVNYEMLLREMENPEKEEFQRLKRANRNFGRFLVCEDDTVKENASRLSNLEKKDGKKKGNPEEPAQPHDQFLILAASSLIAEYLETLKSDSFSLAEFFKSKIKWIDTRGYPNKIREKLDEMEKEYNQLAEPKLEEIDLKANTSTLESLNIENQQDQLDLLLFMAAMILEHGIQCSPYNSSIRILLCKIYQKFGAVESAYTILQNLNLKHVQHDSLGYLGTFQCLMNGSYQNAERLLAFAEFMYPAFWKEGIEHVVTAYRCDNLNKVGEILEFRRRLLNSINCGLVFCEKRLHDYVITCSIPNFTTMAEFASRLEKEFTFIGKEHLLRTSGFTDNRDFSVIEGLEENLDKNKTELLKKISATHDLHFYKIRVVVLSVLTKLIRHTEKLDDKEKTELELLTSIKLFDERMEEWNKEKGRMDANTILDHHFLHQLDPVCHKYDHLGCGVALQKLFGFVGSLLTSATSADTKECSLDGEQTERDFTKIVEESFEQILKKVSFSDVEKKEIILSEISISEVFFSFHFAVETLAFFRIVLECVIKIDEHCLNQSQGLEKPKKNKPNEQMENLHKKHISWVKHLKDQVETVLSSIHDFQSKLCSMKYQKWKEQKDFLESQLHPATFAHLFQSQYEVVAFRLQSSYENQSDEIKKVAQDLFNCLNYIMISRTKYL